MSVSGPLPLPRLCTGAGHALISCSRVFEALVSVLDNALGQIVAALEARRAWKPPRWFSYIHPTISALFPRFRRCME